VITAILPFKSIEFIQEKLSWATIDTARRWVNHPVALDCGQCGDGHCRTHGDGFHRPLSHERE
jgi:hypothetical protein